jgi:hypothetical protein
MLTGGLVAAGYGWNIHVNLRKRKVCRKMKLQNLANMNELTFNLPETSISLSKHIF